MKNMTDEELIRLAKGGDSSSLEFLLARYKTLASKIARSYFLVGAEYEDILQEAMIGLYKAYCSFDEKNGTAFAIFAKKCIERNIQSAVKSANRQKNYLLNSSVSLSSQGGLKISNDEKDDDIELILPSSSLSPDEKLIESEKLLEIKEQIIKTLSVFELKVLTEYLKGNNYQDIARTLNETPKSIDNALTRIKHKLSYLNK